MNDPLLGEFPGLASGYRTTSQATDEYNCIAWAAGRDDCWWWPGHLDGFWPPGVPAVATLAAFEAAYRFLGYELCPSGGFEPQFEKIAIFSDADNVPTHAARQLMSGRWTSKLGREVDIEHGSPEALTSGVYGAPALFMRRRRPLWQRVVALVLRTRAKL